jgi:hypothetical protein
MLFLIRLVAPMLKLSRVAGTGARVPGSELGASMLLAVVVFSEVS